LHNEKKKNAELFQQTMEIAQRHGIPVTPFMRFVKRFESVYEVQTRLVLNKQQLRKNLESTHDHEFLMPLIEQVSICVFGIRFEIPNSEQLQHARH
jgi:hypothetical protein